MQNFILLFVTVLFVSSIFINGWFEITRGRWEIRPDGKKEWVGKIFNFWHKFFQQHKEKKAFYKDDEFLKAWVKVALPLKPEQIIELLDNNAHVKAGAKDLNKLKAVALEKGYGLQWKEYSTDKTEYLLNLYKMEQVYKFSDYIKDPLGTCITCFSSVYGVIMWLFWYNVGVQVNLVYPTETVDALIALPMVAKGVLMVVFCISLAYVNELLNGINTKLKK